MNLRVSDAELRALVVGRLDILTEAEFDNAQAMAKRLRTSVGRILISRGLPEGFLLQQLAQAWGIPYVDLKVSDIITKALDLVDEEFARSHVVIPLDAHNGSLKLAMSDPRNREVLEELQRKTKLKIEPCLAAGPSILRAQLLYKRELREMLNRAATNGSIVEVRSRKPEEHESKAAELLVRILEYAAITKSSDIHIEPYEIEVLVRCRIDGVLQDVMSLPPPLLPSLVSHIKVLAGMRIDERRAPQDGHFETSLTDLKFDLRVSSLPTQWGEKLVIRMLSREFLVYELEDLGLGASDFEVLLPNILRPHGLLLVTGPTGSGKSTSLYAMLTRLAAEKKYLINISTVEDPVEYTLPRINQVSVNIAAGLTFAAALRSILRQDPDAIMVGEIRDRETADMAIRAALVGRLLLSTLHTNDATSAVIRMIDIGIEPFLLASTLALVISQRLVRRICTNCRESMPPPPSMIAALRARHDFEATVRALQSQNVLGRGDYPLSGIRLFQGKGCAQCQGTGFRGRLGVFELFQINDTVRAMIMQRSDAASIRAAAISAGMKTLFQDGLAKVFIGETSLEEVLRVAL
jgi:type IV pilus assembly protein PilB